MLIIGHKNIPFLPLYRVQKKDSIHKTPPNSTVLFDFSQKELLAYTQKNDLTFALHVNSLREACLANAMKAAFLIVPKKIAAEIQSIANEYLFDAKILVSIQEEYEIETIAKQGIDGVIFPEGLLDIA